MSRDPKVTSRRQRKCAWRKAYPPGQVQVSKLTTNTPPLTPPPKLTINPTTAVPPNTRPAPTEPPRPSSTAAQRSHSTHWQQHQNLLEAAAAGKREKASSYLSQLFPGNARDIDVLGEVVCEGILCSRYCAVDFETQDLFEAALALLLLRRSDLGVLEYDREVKCR